MVRLKPTNVDVSGSFTLQLIGGTNHTIRTGTKRSGDHRETFNINTIPEREFTAVKFSWVVSGKTVEDTHDYRFQNLGNYRHSQYNIPEERQCNGVATASYATTNACVFTATNFRSQFFSQVNLNGSGISINHGNIKREFYCLSHPSSPADASERSFRTGEDFAGSCGRLGNDTVAVLPSHPYLQCGDQVYLVGSGVKVVTDYCPGCAQNQLDNYTTNHACSGIGDFGNHVTIKLF
jgi:hypothetical protein